MSKNCKSVRTNMLRKNDPVSAFSEIKKFVLMNTNDPTLLSYLAEIRQALTQTRYGLIFEEHTEDIEKILQKNQVVLVEQKEMEINHGERLNLLIEGENLAVLRHLITSYFGKVDVIYVDPPYNTGMKSLNYNDYDFADPTDSYTHSKWLSFMEKRLRIAYDLLSQTGVMFIHIDEHETGTLLLLCQGLFGEANVVTLVWPKTDPKFDENRVEKPFRDIKIVHENIFVCFKERNKTNFNSILISSNVSGEEKETPSHMESILKGLGTTSSAKDELKELLGRRDIFQTPKPVKLVKELIRAAAGKNVLVLDLFAGSGTTGHAVMDLNLEDRGQRKFILINNDENAICKKVTYERLRKVLETEHYQEGLRYFKVKYVPRVQ